MASTDDGDEVIFEKVKAILSSSWANKNDERRKDLFIRIKKKFRNVEIRYAKGSYVFVGTFDEIAQIEKLIREFGSLHTYGRNPEINVNKKSENSFLDGWNTNKELDKSEFETDRKGIPHQNPTNGASGGSAGEHGTGARDGSDGRKDGEDRSDEEGSSSKSKVEPTGKGEYSNGRKESNGEVGSQDEIENKHQHTVPSFIWNYIVKYKLEELNSLKMICPIIICKVKTNSVDMEIGISPSSTTDQVSKFDEFFKLCSHITSTSLEIDIGEDGDERLKNKLEEQHPKVELKIESSSEGSGHKFIFIGEDSDIEKAKEFCKNLASSGLYGIHF